MGEQLNSDVFASIMSMIDGMRKEFRQEFKELRDEIRDSEEDKVTHREWAQRNAHVDNRLSGLGREIGDLRIEMKAKSAPWWSVGSLVVAAFAALWSVFRPL